MEELGTILALLILVAPWILKAFEGDSDDEEAIGPESFDKPDPTSNDPLEPR